MPFSSLRFRYPWRPYQQRVLDAIEEHLHDRKLHVVAAPGAGKTSLGLEIFRRLQRRTLILSPTRVIRDQWLLRLQDFLAEGDGQQPAWVSSSLTSPGLLTSITYQALHARLATSAHAADEEEAEDAEADDAVTPPTAAELDDLIGRLKTQQLGVLIVDEAHHLREEWWRVLTQLHEGLPGVVLVSLTATPPYDVEQQQWLKYEQLCGPIDEEISVPELVKAGTLCPHQDYLWPVAISDSDKAKMLAYDRQVLTLCDELFGHPQFNQLITSHPWLTSLADSQQIAAEPRVAMALLVFLKARQLPLPPGLCRLLDVTADDIGELGRQWWQDLVEAALFSPSFSHRDTHLPYVDELKKTLRAAELLRGRELSLVRARFIERSLALSVTKIKACGEIHRLEAGQRGESLRQVILTDYIRDEQRTSTGKHTPLSLGCWPVFLTLYRQTPWPQHLAMLSGRLTIIHRQLLPFCQQQLGERLKVAELAEAPDYCQLVASTALLVPLITTLLVNGQLRTLIGTRALLGEGWDAPVVNSLILASSVGTFMQTNQMRGRAIRVDRHQPDKCSSIWHLVAIDRSSLSGLSDYFQLVRRFNSFVGLSEKDNLIESGFARLAAHHLEYFVKEPDRGSLFLQQLQSSRRFKQHPQLASRWRHALALGSSGRVSPAVSMVKPPSLRHLHFTNSLKHLLITLAVVVSVPLTMVATQGYRALPPALVVALALLLWRLPQALRLVRMLLFHLPADGSLLRMGYALCEALCQLRLITTPLGRLRVISHPGPDGRFTLVLTGGSYFESALFADCMAELLAPIDNPRYLLTRPGTFAGMQRRDYHAVPLTLGISKQRAESFYASWCRYLGPSELIYTRQASNRAILASARVRALSALEAREVKRFDRW